MNGAATKKLKRKVTKAVEPEKKREVLIPVLDVSGFEPKKAAFLQALERTLGNFTEAARLCGYVRQTPWYWMQKDKAFALAVKQVDEMQLDFVEQQLKKNITNGDTTAMIFYLKTRGKHRGYVERHENHNLNETVTVRVPDEEPPEDIPYELSDDFFINDNE